MACNNGHQIYDDHQIRTTAVSSRRCRYIRCDTDKNCSVITVHRTQEPLSSSRWPH